MADDDPHAEIETLRNRLRSGDRYVQYDADRDHLIQMSDNIRLTPSEIGDHRHLKLLRHCSRIAQLVEAPHPEDFDDDEADWIDDHDDVEQVLEKQGILGAALDYRAVAEQIVRWIHSEYENEHTNQDYRTAIRSFGRYRLKREEPPETLAWIPTGTSNDFDPTPSRRDLLDYEEHIIPMLEACHNARDQALIAVQFEAGLRGGELWNLRVGDIFDADHSVGIHADGKEGEKPVHLIMSVPYLQQWLNDHPSGADEDYLWTKLNTPERPSRPTFYNYFADVAERAGVDKDVHPTILRKSNTRYLIQLGMNPARIDDRQGRVRGSEHTARYHARFSDQSNEAAYARLHGIDVESDQELLETSPVECPRCHRETPRHEDFCMFCQHALSFDAVEEDESFDDAMVDGVAQTARGDVDVEDLDETDILEARELVKENPVLKQLLFPD